MKFAISRNNGQYQFWHIDCKGGREAPMHSPKHLVNDVKEFQCARCGNKGQATMPNIVVGQGELEETK